MIETLEFHNPSDVFDPAFHWTYRIIRASVGTTTGLIAMAMLAKSPRIGPAFGPTCVIMPDGNVYTNVRALRLTDKGGKVTWEKQMIGHIVAVRDNMRRLADHCKLSDSDREEMFEELRKWVVKDYRARSEN